MVLNHVRLAVFYRVVFRIIECLIKFTDLYLWNVEWGWNKCSRKQSFYLLTLLSEKKEAILLKTRLTHILLLKEKSVVWNLWSKINKKTYIECNLFLFIYRILKKCWMRIVVFAPRFRKASRMLGISMRMFTTLQIVTLFSIDIWRIYLVIR